MLLAAFVAHRRFVPSLPATWRGASDDVADFDFNLGKSFEKLKATMKGLTGTCLSGTHCSGNTGAVQQSCDETGNCKPLGMVFCCTDPMSKIMASVNDNGEVTCSCSTASKTIQGFEHKIMDFKKDGVKVINKLKAWTGQCLSGEAICEGKPMHRSYGDTLYCCPSGAQGSARLRAKQLHARRHRATAFPDAGPRPPAQSVGAGAAHPEATAEEPCRTKGCLPAVGP